MRVNKSGVVFLLLLAVVAVYGVYHFSPGAASSHDAGPPSSIPDQVPDNASIAAARTVDNQGSETHQVPTKRTDLHASFLNLQRCYYASRDLATSKNVADCKRLEGKPEFERQYAACLSKWVEAHDRASAAQGAMAGCGNERDLVKRYFDATKAAAENGDPDAQLCYLSSDFAYSEGKPEYSDADIKEYQKVGPRYVDDAFKRGDWRIVALLSTRHFDSQSGLLANLDDIGQPQTAYKMERLLRLGASGDYATALDGFMDDLIHPDLKPEAGLPPSKIEEADAWAKQMYSEHFAGVPGLTQAPGVCGPDVSLLTY